MAYKAYGAGGRIRTRVNLITNQGPILSATPALITAGHLKRLNEQGRRFPHLLHGFVLGRQRAHLPLLSDLAVMMQRPVTPMMDLNNSGPSIWPFVHSANKSSWIDNIHTALPRGVEPPTFSIRMSCTSSCATVANRDGHFVDSRVLDRGFDPEFLGNLEPSAHRESFDG